MSDHNPITAQPAAGMNGHFGIDSAADARTYYDRAVAAYGKPAFIGRYLPVYSVTPEERDYIHAQGVAILALWNRDQTGTLIGSGLLQVGRDQAEAACAAWGALGLPAGSVIVYDVESNMFLSGPGLQGWIEGCHAAGYTPGVYLNPPNGRNHTAGYQAARAATKGLACVQFTSQWELYAYDNAPQRTFLVDGQHAAAVPGYEAECVVWQSYENDLSGTVDLDCANDQGLALMWNATPAKPPTPSTHYHVIKPGDLKASADHGSKPAIDKRHRAVILEVGDKVTTTGAPVADPNGRDTWVPCKLVPPLQVVHGWFLKGSLEQD